MLSKNNTTFSQINSKEDTIEDSLKKIEQAILIEPKLDNLTYGNLVDYTFKKPTNKFMASKDKINNLLYYLNLKRKKLGEINEQYLLYFQFLFL